MSAQSSVYENNVLLTELSKLARADISCQFMKTRSLCRHVLQNEWTLISASAFQVKNWSTRFKQEWKFFQLQRLLRVWYKNAWKVQWKITKLLIKEASTPELVQPKSKSIFHKSPTYFYVIYEWTFCCLYLVWASLCGLKTTLLCTLLWNLGTVE